ncbi:response regulator transcription factor [Mesobaculum littorinae]|uniref:Response regulator transcription factor n=1 Tax=Mesobaculum littorinae TaxID=2486419 RepID=A0A438AFF0_9RHOB|nr:response regulator transcription factor [Mesobaculum littorinae]RVV97434.1 response regulator transcription factor [Mesobaculum littorinae]
MRLILADDHALLRDALSQWLTRTQGLEVGTAADLPEALHLAAAPGAAWDVALLDYAMPGMEGLRGLDRMIAARPEMKVALMSGVATCDIAPMALSHGAAGFVPKTLAPESLMHALTFMAAGERYLPPDAVTSGTRAAALAQRLSVRERQVLKGLSQGKSNKLIARDLQLSEPTIKLHVKTLYRKMGISNRTQAALLAVERGLC